MITDWARTQASPLTYIFSKIFTSYQNDMNNVKNRPIHKDFLKYYQNMTVLPSKTYSVYLSNENFKDCVDPHSTWLNNFFTCFFITNYNLDHLMIIHLTWRYPNCTYFDSFFNYVFLWSRQKFQFCVYFVAVSFFII